MVDNHNNTTASSKRQFRSPKNAPITTNQSQAVRMALNYRKKFAQTIVEQRSPKGLPK